MAGYDGDMRRSIPRLLILLTLAGCEKPKTYTAQEVRRDPIPFESASPSKAPAGEFSSPRLIGTESHDPPRSESTPLPNLTEFARPTSTGSATAGGPPKLSLDGVSDGFGLASLNNPLNVTVDALVQSQTTGSAVERTRRELDRSFRTGLEHLQRRQFDQALFHFEKMQTADPKDVRGFLGAGETYMQKNDVGRALAVFEIAARTHPDDGSLNFARARAYFSINNLSQTVAILTKVLAKAPDLVDARWMRGIANLRRRNPQAIDEDAEALMRISPKGPEGYLLKAISRGMLGDLEEGRKWYLESEKLGLPKQAIDVWRPQFFPPTAP